MLRSWRFLQELVLGSGSGADSPADRFSETNWLDWFQTGPGGLRLWPVNPAEPDPVWVLRTSRVLRQSHVGLLEAELYWVLAPCHPFILLRTHQLILKKFEAVINLDTLALRQFIKNRKRPQKQNHFWVLGVLFQ